MNGPWDVKSVRQSDQYISCMKLNGVPLLPPVLSKECHEEMKNYKFLAQEVEKRIEALKSLIVESDINSSEDETDAPELPESDQSYETPSVKPVEINVEKIKPVTLGQHNENGYDNFKFNMSNTFENNSPTLSNVSDSYSSKASSKLVIDLSLSINDTARNLLDSNNTSQTPNDVPERDCDCTHNDERKINNFDENKKNSVVEDKLTLSVSINKEAFSDPIASLQFSQEGPSSLGAKSFTGSLNDLHIESVKESQAAPLLRQRSYTVLKPSPMLLAHLEVQSLNKGVDVKSISMSESLSNVHCINKKRRSWDLETAKVKWSSMALELKEKVKDKHLKNNIKNSNTKPMIRNHRTQSNTPTKAKSLSSDKAKRGTPSVKSEPVQKPRKMRSPVRNCPIEGQKQSPLPQSEVHKDVAKQKPISESEDPATRVRELYEKIQKQQLVQMANLVEKQKREQMLLQQVFEEQNNLLFTQLKTICPKSPNEVKEAWVEKDAQSGPVSLSQLINQKPENTHNSPVISTLTETNNYINQCDKILKKSRNMSESIKKQQPLHQDGEKMVSSKSLAGSKTRTHSPNYRNTPASRKLVYDTSVSSDRETILTDRTNDTLADLNVTFPSDHSDECPHSNSTLTNICTNVQIESPLSAPVAAASSRSTEKAIKSMEETIQNSIKSMCTMRTKQNVCRPSTAQERAAATKIVAYAKGYLVRRLMKTERVQGTVQTIKDTLILALQLHQDGKGIWGADVDLHRRLIQQITAACYTLHDTFVASTPSERCAMIATDRNRKKILATRPPFRHYRPTDVMSQSHSGAFPARPKRSSPSLMTQSNYENFSGEKVRRYMQSPRRRPWR